MNIYGIKTKRAFKTVKEGPHKGKKIAQYSTSVNGKVLCTVGDTVFHRKGKAVAEYDNLRFIRFGINEALQRAFKKLPPKEQQAILNPSPLPSIKEIRESIKLIDEKLAKKR